MGPSVQIPESVIAVHSRHARGTSAASEPRSAQGGPRHAHRLPRSRTAFVASLCALVLLASTGLFGFSAYTRLNNNIARVDVNQILGTDRPTQQGPTIGGDPWAGQARTILIIGSDTRTGQTGIHDNVDGGQRSDTMMLVHLAADRSRADVVSIPRDSVVRIPSCPLAGGGSTRPTTTRINAAYSMGGTACIIKTLETLTDVRIDDYVVVDFNGFRDMVNAIGGLEVCLPKAMRDRKAGLNVPAGRQRLSGDMALAFVRARYAEGDGSDLGRLDRQHAFLAAVMHQVATMNLLTDAPKLYGFLDAATKSVTTDEELGSVSIMARLAGSVHKIPQDMINYETVPVTENPADRNTVLWQAQGSTALWSALRDDTPPPGAPGAPGPTSGTTGAAPSTGPSTPAATPSAPAPAAPAGTPTPSQSADSIICP